MTCTKTPRWTLLLALCAPAAAVAAESSTTGAREGAQPAPPPTARTALQPQTLYNDAREAFATRAFRVFHAAWAGEALADRHGRWAAASSFFLRALRAEAAKMQDTSSTKPPPLEPLTPAQWRVLLRSGRETKTGAVLDDIFQGLAGRSYETVLKALEGRGFVSMVVSPAEAAKKLNRAFQKHDRARAALRHIAPLYFDKESTRPTDLDAALERADISLASLRSIASK